MLVISRCPCISARQGASGWTTRRIRSELKKNLAEEKSLMMWRMWSRMVALLGIGDGGHPSCLGVTGNI